MAALSAQLLSYLSLLPDAWFPLSRISQTAGLAPPTSESTALQLSSGAPLATGSVFSLGSLWATVRPPSNDLMNWVGVGSREGCHMARCPQNRNRELSPKCRHAPWHQESQA